jgi:hypothetical protein
MCAQPFLKRSYVETILRVIVNNVKVKFNDISKSSASCNNDSVNI